MNRTSLIRFAWLSIAAAVLTITLKTGAYLLTDSVGLLSDALESVVNLVAAIVALAALAVAARPPDEEHAYGHEKVEYFSSGVEGGLILLAALSIAVTAVNRLLHPEPVEQLGLGIAVSSAASLVNLGAALILRRAGTTHHSIALEADGRHLMTDVWTSVGVLIGVAGVGLTGWRWLDAVVALVVAANITWSGFHLVRRSMLGLLDTTLPEEERIAVAEVLRTYEGRGIQFHALRTRQAGARQFVSMHVLVPGTWSVKRGHTILEAIEHDIRDTLAGVTVFTHLEPLDDPLSWDDTALDRAVAHAEAESAERG